MFILEITLSFYHFKSTVLSDHLCKQAGCGILGTKMAAEIGFCSGRTQSAAYWTSEQGVIFMGIRIFPTPLSYSTFRYGFSKRTENWLFYTNMDASTFRYAPDPYSTIRYKTPNCLKTRPFSIFLSQRLSSIIRYGSFFYSTFRYGFLQSTEISASSLLRYFVTVALFLFDNSLRFPGNS